MAYTNIHRTFMQAYLLERFAQEDYVQNLYRRCCEACEVAHDPDDFSAFVGVLNETLDTLDMELRKGQAPDTGTTYYALVNTNGDEIAQLATTFTPNEVVFLKHLIELMMNADDEAFAIPSTAALRTTTPLNSKKDAQNFIERLVKNQWLDDRNGILSLSLRGVLELQTYLKNQYPDTLEDCTICLEIVTTNAERCGTDNCTARLHQHCARKYFANRAERRCPACQEEWRGVTTGRRRAGRQEEREDEEMEDARGEDVGMSRKRTRQSARLGGGERDEEGEDEGGRADDGDGEEEEEEEEVLRPRRKGKGRA
ncbi:Non-structural maintenance of chromosomes element 1 [Rhizophlyctis rosea]|nr:Non-structural maintenance of chromosomes element 1 [Rhizophlyctis rosea]